MLSTTFLPLGSLPSRGEGSSQTGLTRELRSQLRSASSLFVAASAVGDIPTLPKTALVVVDSATSTEMVCSPPRTQTPTYVANYTRRLNVPATALAARKTRKRRTGGGDGGGDDGWGGNDDGGSFGGGNGDDGFGSGGEDGPFEGDSLGRLTQDIMLLWTVFCGWSLYNVAQHVTRPKSPTLSAVVYSTLKAQLLREPTSAVFMA